MESVLFSLYCCWSLCLQIQNVFKYLLKKYHFYLHSQFSFCSKIAVTDWALEPFFIMNLLYVLLHGGFGNRFLTNWARFFMVDSYVHLQWHHLFVANLAYFLPKMRFHVPVNINFKGTFVITKVAGKLFFHVAFYMKCHLSFNAESFRTKIAKQLRARFVNGSQMINYVVSIFHNIFTKATSVWFMYTFAFISFSSKCKNRPVRKFYRILFFYTIWIFNYCFFGTKSLCKLCWTWKTC